MRIVIKFDSATSEETRALLAALSSEADKRGTRVHVNGPEHWAGETEPLDRHEAMAVLSTADLRASVAQTTQRIVDGG